MNNKGFIFAETLAATLVIFILIISFYVFSTNFIDNQSKNKNYENIEEIYKLANVRLFLYRTTNLNSVFNDYLEGTQTCVSLNNINFSDSEEYTLQYANMLNEFKIRQIYLCDFYGSNDFNDAFKDYFEYTKNTFKDRYRIIANFNNNKFASIKAWRISNE